MGLLTKKQNFGFCSNSSNCSKTRIYGLCFYVYNINQIEQESLSCSWLWWASKPDQQGLSSSICFEGMYVWICLRMRFAWYYLFEIDIIRYVYHSITNTGLRRLEYTYLMYPFIQDISFIYYHLINPLMYLPNIFIDVKILIFWYKIKLF